MVPHLGEIEQGSSLFLQIKFKSPLNQLRKRFVFLDSSVLEPFDHIWIYVDRHLVLDTRRQIITFAPGILIVGSWPGSPSHPSTSNNDI